MSSQKISTALGLFLCLSFSVLAQKNGAFQAHYGGTGDDFASSVIQLPDNGFLLTGLTRGYGAGGLDILMIRIDSVGNKIWSKTVGGPNDEGFYPFYFNYLIDAILTPDNNIVVCTSTSSYGQGGEDIYLLKSDLNGNIKWTKTFGGSANDYGMGICNDPNGGYLITGEYGRSSATDMNSDGSGDLIVLKVDTAGKTVWAKTYGTSSNEESGQKIIRSRDGHFLIGGNAYVSSSSSHNNLIMKIDDNGKLIWSKVYGYGSYNPFNGMTELPDKTIYTGGFIYTSQNEPYISKFDSTGKWLHTQAYNEYGAFRTLDYDPVHNVLNTSLATISNSGTQRMSLMRLDTSGGFIFNKSFGPISNSKSYTIGEGHDLINLKEGGFGYLISTAAFGFGGYDFYFLKSDTNDVPNNCNIYPTTVSESSMSLTDRSYTFSVTAITPATDKGGVVSSQNISTFIDCPPYVANFVSTNSCIGDTSHFYDESYPKPDSWKWNFGDPNSSSNTSVIQNPKHAYSQSGIFKVTLISGNGTNSDTFIRKIVISALPVIAPWTQTTNNHYGVTFIPKDTTIGTFKWYFGDSANDSSSLKVPTYTYPAMAGKYLVKLLVTNIYGCKALASDSVTIKLSGIGHPGILMRGIKVYPNPCQGISNIEYYLTKAENVNISLIDLSGKSVALIKNGPTDAGKHIQVFDAKKYDCRPGTYILKLMISDQVYITRIEIMK